MLVAHEIILQNIWNPYWGWVRVPGSTVRLLSVLFLEALALALWGLHVRFRRAPNLNCRAYLKYALFMIPFGTALSLRSAGRKHSRNLHFSI